MNEIRRELADAIHAYYPSFDLDSLPGSIPDDWKWGGDSGAVGPNFYAPYEGRNGEWEGFTVIIDHADPKDREIPTAPRFHILVDDSGCSTDDWNFVLLIDQMRREANKYTEIARLIDETEWIPINRPPPVRETADGCGLESGPVIGLVSGVVCVVYYFEHFGPAWFTKDGEDVTRKITHWR